MPSKYGGKKQYARKKVQSARKVVPSAAVVRAVKSVMNKQVETKFVINSVTESFLSTLSSPAPSNAIVLNNINQGASQQGRNGGKVTAKYVDIRGSFHSPSEVPLYLKILLVMSNENDDPTLDLLESGASVFAPAGADFSAIYARINTTKYRVLGTKLLKFGNTAGYVGTQLFSMNVNLKNATMNYDQGNSACSNKKLTLVYFTRRSDNDESLGTVGEITWNSKFYFTDM